MEKYIVEKSRKTLHRMNINEWVLIITNFCAGTFILAVDGFSAKHLLFIWLMAGWMYLTGFFVFIKRVLRIRDGKRFDRSMLGDLHHAISAVTYRVWLSLIMRWNALPIGMLVLFGLWDNQKPAWTIGLVVLLFLSLIWIGRWEHKIYKAQKRELEMLIHDLSIQ